MNKLTMLLCSMMMATPVLAGQTVYKCPSPDGKLIYQQNTCVNGEGAELAIETGKPSSTRKATDQEEADCLYAVRTVYKYKDPDSLRVEGGVYVNEYPSGREEVLMSINGKNSYGAYAGAKPAKCSYKAHGVIEDVQAF